METITLEEANRRCREAKEKFDAAEAARRDRGGICDKEWVAARADFERALDAVARAKGLVREP